MCGIMLLASLSMLSAPPCPPGCPCGCGDGHGCVCAAYATGAKAPDAIQTAMRTATAKMRDVVVEVAGMSSAGIDGCEGAVTCSVKAVEGHSGPAVYLGKNEGGGKFTWWRYTRQPVAYYYVPPPPPMFFAPMFGGCGVGGCCGGR